MQGKVMLRFIQCPRHFNPGNGIALAAIRARMFGMDVAWILKEVEMTPRTIMGRDISNRLIRLPAI
ncbi:hypothetical protein ABD76_22030 [Paenibacillus dendritiformis]|nr:hypothetical protein [Paenibacillus dendritiformis]MBG9792129.1 hypothetical protein [Paenibacillus dendritiformis]MBG9793275.1 hypothetical protein [Paenibacillus dendritiformis]MBG9794998.1 hypothetical protein [Paenibacillus dendritiformis]